MSPEPTHPITTAKGASALTILLGVVSVFAPFLIDFKTALLFGAVAIFVIGWLYWAEAKVAIASRAWNSNLNVPLLSVAVMVMMAVVSEHNVANAPKPVPPVSAEDVAQRVEDWLQHHQPRTAQADSRNPIPEKLHESEVMSLPPPKIIHKSPAVASEDPEKGDKWLEELSKKATGNIAKLKAYSECNDASRPIYFGLYKLIADAANDQNSWAYSRDGDLLRRQYEAWMGAVHQFFAEHSDALPDRTAFEQIQDLDMEPTLLIIPNSGLNAWQNFDARRKALNEITDQFNKVSCKAESDALHAKDGDPFERK